MSITSDSAASRPRGFQFGIATLFIAMLWIGLICVALRSPTKLLTAAVTLPTYLLVCGATLAIGYRSGRTRAIAAGFAIFSGGYLLHQVFAPYYASPFGSIFESVFHFIHVDHRIPLSVGGEMLTPPDYDSQDFVAICENAMACAFGAVGAILAQFLYATQRREPPESGSVRP